MANWERKSHYLLREIVKFRTYIDTLAAAQVQKQKIYAEREALEEKALDDGDAASSSQSTENDGAKEAPKASGPIDPQVTTPAFLLHP
jgi:protein-disulfide isomerase